MLYEVLSGKRYGVEVCAASAGSDGDYPVVLRRKWLLGGFLKGESGSPEVFLKGPLGEAFVGDISIIWKEGFL